MIVIITQSPVEVIVIVMLAMVVIIVMALVVFFCSCCHGKHAEKNEKEDLHLQDSCVAGQWHSQEIL